MDSVKQAHYLSSYQQDDEYFLSVAANKLLDLHKGGKIIINPQKEKNIIYLLNFLSNANNINDPEYYDNALVLTTFNPLIIVNKQGYHMEITPKNVVLLLPTNKNIPMDFLNY